MAWLKIPIPTNVIKLIVAKHLFIVITTHHHFHSSAASLHCLFITNLLLKIIIMTNQIYPCLWFDGKAKAAAEFYCSIFPGSKIITDTPMVVNFEITGKKMMGLNGGPLYKFSPATSFVIECETQEEIDFYWEKLGEDGKYNQCGWLDDKFGISWQIVPIVLGKLMSDPEKAPKVMQAFCKMSKFNIEELLNT